MKPTFAPSGVIGLGTTRGPKIAAVQTALETIFNRAETAAARKQPVIESRSVPSGTESTPRTVSSMRIGARHRAERVWAKLEDEGLEVALAIGLEGGVWRPDESESGSSLLESWAYVTDGRAGYFGSSGSVQLPERISHRVFQLGEELGDAADAEFETTDIAGGAGTFGVLTANLVTREAAFVRALLHALAPFYNDGVYH